MLEMLYIPSSKQGIQCPDYYNIMFACLCIKKHGERVLFQAANKIDMSWLQKYSFDDQLQTQNENLCVGKNYISLLSTHLISQFKFGPALGMLIISSLVYY